MYASLKKWMNLNLQIKPFIRRSGTGTIIYGDTVSVKCFAVEKVTLVMDKTGAEVISNTQLYIDGSISISEMDNVIFNNLERPIKTISTYYASGIASLKVVYL